MYKSNQIGTGHAGNYKTLMKGIKEGKVVFIKSFIVFINWKTQRLKVSALLKWIKRFNIICVKISAKFLIEKIIITYKM